MALGDQAEVNLLFYDYVRDLVESRLQEQRLSEDLPHPTRPPMTRAGITAVLSQDFSQDNVELETWSALYHHYISPVALTEADLQQALPVSSAQLSPPRPNRLRSPDMVAASRRNGSSST
ncbi:MAG: hypothetical protein M5U34_13205 [Chloroflexi bacterium]|nr:hypothetical protein [Chloroflexota bacterium]